MFIGITVNMHQDHLLYVRTKRWCSLMVPKLYYKSNARGYCGNNFKKLKQLKKGNIIKHSTDDYFRTITFCSKNWTRQYWQEGIERCSYILYRCYFFFFFSGNVNILFLLLLAIIFYYFFFPRK